MRERASLVFSVIALVFSLLGLTGLGRAAKAPALPPRSVGTAQLKNGAVTAAKVRSHSLVAGNFKRGQLKPGPQGKPGPPGPSDGYAASLVGPAPVAVGDTPVALASLQIPQAGNYVIEAKAYFESTGNGIASLTCRLDTLAGDADEVQLLAGNPTPVALEVAHTYPQPGSVELLCAGRAPAAAHYVRIAAIRVGSLTSTDLG